MAVLFRGNHVYFRYRHFAPTGGHPVISVETITNGSEGPDQNRIDAITGQRGIGGTWTLTVVVAGRMQTTAVMVARPTAAQLQAALEVLPIVGVGNVLVEIPVWNPWRYEVTWRGALAGDACPASITPDNTDITDGHYTQTVVQVGRTARDDVQRITATTDDIPGPRIRLRLGGLITAPIAWGSSAVEVAGALGDLPELGWPNVRGTGGPLGVRPITITFTGDLGSYDRPELIATTMAPEFAEGKVAFGQGCCRMRCASSTLTVRLSGFEDLSGYDFSEVHGTYVLNEATPFTTPCQQTWTAEVSVQPQVGDSYLMMLGATAIEGWSGAVGFTGYAQGASFGVDFESAILAADASCSGASLELHGSGFGTATMTVQL